jgi:hypothetical protein
MQLGVRRADDANEMWPGVCQSWVSTTCVKAGAIRLMIG